MKKRFIPLFEEFASELPEDTNMPEGDEDGFDGPTNHVSFLQNLFNATEDEIRQYYLNGELNTETRKKIAATRLGGLQASDRLSPEGTKLFHELNDNFLGESKFPNWHEGIEFGKRRNEVPSDDVRKKRNYIKDKIDKLEAMKKKTPNRKVAIGGGPKVSIDDAISYYKSVYRP